MLGEVRNNFLLTDQEEKHPPPWLGHSMTLGRDRGGCCVTDSQRRGANGQEPVYDQMPECRRCWKGRCWGRDRGSGRGGAG